jgi:O-antigen ligase
MVKSNHSDDLASGGGAEPASLGGTAAPGVRIDKPVSGLVRMEGSDLHPGEQPVSAKAAAREASARRLGLWAVALVAAIFALVPLVFDPNAVILTVATAFYPIKFKLLMALSAALLAAVLGATLLGARIVRVPVLVPAVAFLVISTLSTLQSGDILHSLIGGVPYRYDGLLSLAAGVLLFYAAARFLDSWAKVRIVALAGITSAVLISIYGILQSFGLDPVLSWGIPWYTMEPVPASTPLSSFYPVMPRAFSTLGWPNWLAAYLTLMVGAALALSFRAQSRWVRITLLAAVALMAACWLYTYTRGAMLGVGVALPVVFFLAHRRLGSVRPLLLPTLVIVAAMVVAQLASPPYMSLSTNLGGTNAASSPEEVPQGGDVSVTTRLMMWRDTVPMIMDRPVLGYGPDNFAEPFERYEGDDLRAFFPGDVIDKAHNEFLQVAATTGLLGLAAYLWIFVSYFRNAYRSGGWPLLALSGGVLAYILQLQTVFTTMAFGITFWAVLGVSVAVMRIQDTERSEPSRKA